MSDYLASDEEASSGILMVPRRPGPWRVISLLAVLTALVVVALSVLQARAASDVAVAPEQQVSLEQTTVTVTDVAAPDGSEVAVLGLLDAQSRRPFDSGGTALDLPSNSAALVSLTNSGGEIIGRWRSQLGQRRGLWSL